MGGKDTGPEPLLFARPEMTPAPLSTANAGQRHAI
jgi:hypothetical protein